MRCCKAFSSAALVSLSLALAVMPVVVEAQTRVSPVVPFNPVGQHPPALRHGRNGKVTIRRAKVAPVEPLAPFRLSAVIVAGSSLTAATLRPAYDRYIGQTLTPTDLANISRRLAAVYAERSGLAFYTVTIPQQTPVNGVLRIDVAEGYVQDVQVKGPAARRDYGLLRHYASKITAERPLRTATLQRYVSLIRDIPGLNPSLQFVEGASVGALTLVITVQPRTIELGVSINNRGTAFLGRTQVELDAALHSLIREGDETHLTLAAPTDGRRFRYYGVSTSQPFGGEGATAQVSYGYLSMRPSYYDLHGRAVSLGFQVSAPLVRRYDQSLFLTVGLDGLNSNNALLGQALSDDHTRAVRSTLSYTRQDPRYALTAIGSVSFGIDGLGARVLNPALSNAQFKKINLKLSANIALPMNAVLRLDSAAQYTSDRLPGAEQFALGGDEFGRAFEAAAITGDRGIAGSGELAWKLSKQMPKSLSGSEVYGFADIGQTHTTDRPYMPSTSQTLASFGAGGRLPVGTKAILQLELARGLTNPIPTEDHEGWRGIFSLKSLF